MARLRPGWFVAAAAAVLLVSAWLPWLTTTADGGGRASAIGGRTGRIGVPPDGFGVGQFLVLLAATLLVAAAMAARRLSARLASTVALTISVGIAVLEVWYVKLYVAAPVSAAYGLWVGAGATLVAVVLSVCAMVAAWSDAEGRS